MKLAVSLAIAAALLGGCAVVDRRADRREAAAEAAYPPEGQFVTVDGRRVHYVQRGSGPDLVLIHGASGNTRDWTFSFVDRVADRYRVTVFDRPGLGYTDRIEPAGDSSPRQQATLLKHAADRLGVQDEIVVGHSLGAAVAMAWGLDHDPAALVIVSGATQPWPGDGLGPLYDLTSSRFGAVTVIPLLTAFATEGIIRRVAESIFKPNPAPPGYVDYVGAPLTLRRDSFAANARQVNTLRPHLVEMSARYPDLALPVEIVHGRADKVVPGSVHAEPLAQQIPGANLTWVEDVGHMPHHVTPGLVVEAIDRAARRAGLR